MGCGSVYWSLAGLTHLICCSAPLALAVPAEVYPQYAANSQSVSDSTCVVLRTYWGHGEGSGAGLLHLLHSLQRQSVQSWEAIVVVMDSKPFPDLARLVQKLNDDRVWVFAEWVGDVFSPKRNGSWVYGYHKLLYDLTDEAVRACSPKTRWVLVTNGDNEYASTAFSQMEAIEQVDVVALDFYSRYQRVTGPPCDRFAHSNGISPCKVNRMRWCHTDLGANALNWPRLMMEKRQFGALGDTANLTPDSFDGVMAETLVAAGWHVHYTNTCLFEHDPSPQRCARLDGVWDDTYELALTSPAGACITGGEASSKMADGQGTLEVVTVDLSHDSHLQEFYAPGEAVVTQIRCLRDVNETSAQDFAWSFFGIPCSAEVDLR